MGQWRQANTGLQRYPRIVISVPSRLSTVDPEVDPITGKPFFRSVEETTANLSRGGVYLRSWEPLEAGRRVIVAIDLPSGGKVELTGRVVWTRRELRPAQASDIEEPGYGIEFSGMSDREIADLDRLIDDLSPASQPQSAPPRSPATTMRTTRTARTARTTPVMTRP